MSEEELKQEVVNNNETVSNEEVATEVLNAPKKGKKEKKPKSKVRSIIEWVLTGIFGVLFVICAAGNIDGMIHKKEHYNQTLRFGYGSFLVLTNSMEPKYKVYSALITKYENPDKIYKKYLSIIEKAKKEIAPEGVDPSDVTTEDVLKSDYEIKIDLTFWGKHVVDVDPTNPIFDDPQYPKNPQGVETPVAITHRLREIQVREQFEKGKGRYVFICSGINEDASNFKPNQYQAFTEKELLGVVKIGSPVLGWFFQIISSPWGLLVFLLIPALYLVITSSLDILKALKEPEEKAAVSTNGETKKIDSLDQLSDEERKRLKEEMLKKMMEGKNGDK